MGVVISYKLAQMLLKVGVKAKNNMEDIPLSDVQDLAHLVKTSYLPVFKRDIENTKLEQRYKEVEKLCEKYLEID